MHVIPDKALNRRPALPARQQGAVAVIVALSLAGLIGIVGLALDLGKLFVAKSELQNSADACALAAARELTGANTNQLKLAAAAGIATGQRHQVLFQGEQVVVERVTFSDHLTGVYQSAFEGTGALGMRFVRCEVNRSEIANWFIQVLNLMPGVDIGDQRVAASAVASVVPGQTTCALPVGVCESGLATKDVGDWLEALLVPGAGLSGDFLWVRFDGQGARDLKDILTGPGQCDVPAANQPIESETGMNVGVYSAWNTRFGAYQGSYNENNAPPDYSGYAYTAKNWDSCQNASEDFFQKRGQFTPIQSPSRHPTGLRVLPPAGASSESVHRNQGADRRLAIVPIVDCGALAGSSHTTTIKSWACVLMLHPLDQNSDSDAFDGCSSGTGNRVFLEYLGQADAPDSPCASAGVVGGPGSVGPLVPALVR
ncbi:pilus assembly protein TadG-related protein [Nitrosomonas halophila]|uniref:Putative Flp pilus-assembly TadE/G-like n=1 Tax=Nitrosomonas halophila TaxID=44576 RepID=A0A1H3P6D5_9PROT|nr:pilus assembly protein TadG-related protein [Nitrosomonas halophila]SDY95939.1 Putative Flp pilus-assembly TadE/G-like [Nitrosomonas halophila]